MLNIEFKKRDLLLLTLLAMSVFMFLALSSINSFKNRYYLEYLKLKEMSFLAENINIKPIPKDEASVRNFLSSNGYNIEQLSQKDDFIELSLREVSGENFAKLSYLLETNGFEIIYIKAADNTGQGRFFVEAGIR